MFVYIFKSLACLALQMETILKKITQPKLPKMKNEVTKIYNEPGTNDKTQNSNKFYWFFLSKSKFDLKKLKSNW